MRFGIVITSLLLFNLHTAEQSEDYKPGSFRGALKLQPMGDGVHMSVIDDFAYTDGYKRNLDATPGFLTDGASIPQALWSVVGSPFTGKYIGAAVVHDVGCTSRKYSWQVTHRLFYDAMLDSKVSEKHAKLLYYGVLIGGPKWREIEIRADRLNRTRTEVESKGGELTVEHDRSVAADKTQPNSYTRHVILLYPRRALTKQSLESFEKELDRRDVAHNPISPQEIERRTETADLFQSLIPSPQ
jgi:hypothetical protein